MSFRKITLINKDIEEYFSRSLVRDTKGALHKEYLYVISLRKSVKKFSK
jgi:hypothetical protein